MKAPKTLISLVYTSLQMGTVRGGPNCISMRKAHEFERVVDDKVETTLIHRLRYHSSLPDKQEPFFPEVEPSKHTLQVNHTAQVRLGKFMRNLLAVEFWTSRGHNGAKNGQQRDAVGVEGTLCLLLFSI